MNILTPKLFLRIGIGEILMELIMSATPETSTFHNIADLAGPMELQAV